MAGLRAVTWTGWAVAAIVVAAAVLAGLAGWIEAGVVAVVGACCLLVGVGSVLGGSWAQVSILLGSTRAKVGETATGELRVHNPGERRVRAGVVELPVGGDAPQFVVPALGGGQTCRRSSTSPPGGVASGCSARPARCAATPWGCC